MSRLLCKVVGGAGFAVDVGERERAAQRMWVMPVPAIDTSKEKTARDVEERRCWVVGG